MIFWFISAVALAAAYLLGSIPTAYLAGRLFKGIDIREHGSKSVGATNALRVLGKGPGSLVFAVDVLKGIAAIIFTRWLFMYVYGSISVTPPAMFDLATAMPWVVSLAAFAVLFGHARSIWLNFTGGKSIATGFGVLLALTWPVALGGLAAFALAVAIFRIVSLGSIAAALTSIVLICAIEQPLPFRLFVIIGGIYVIVRNRANIQRLFAGTEPRLGQSSRN